MRNIIFLLVFTFSIVCVEALTIVDVKGIATDISLKSYRSLELQQVKTMKYKNGNYKTDTWEGIRFDHWLKDNGFTGFHSIKIESYDNYMVNLHKVELDSMPCWIVFRQNGVELDSLEYRILFPNQRELYWVKYPVRVILEDFKPVVIPAHFILMEKFYRKVPLLDNPKPFHDVKGYSFDQLMSDFFHEPEGCIVLFSRDGLKLRLEYPKHLEKAILALNDEGHLNLMSPIIPGGMWIKDIVFIQCGRQALIMEDYLNNFNVLAKNLSWNLDAGVKAEWKNSVTVKTTSLIDISADRELFIKTDWFEISE